MEAANDNKLPQSRAEAKATGAKHYFTGKVCVNGHTSKRLTSNGHCVGCDRARGKKRSIEERANNLEETRSYYRAYSRKRYHQNSEAVRAYHREWQRRSRATPKGALNNRMSTGINKSIVSGSKRRRPWESIVGYTVGDLMRHLESLFSDGMSWENYGEWHIDHKTPKSAFNYSTPDEIDFKRCWALSNLQPMWATENLSKGAKLPAPFQPSLALAA